MHFDYHRAISDYMIERRGKGTALSAADQQTLDDWEEREVPLHVVLRGIDRAFERKAERPKSLKDCKRFVTYELKAWRQGDDGEPSGKGRRLVPRASHGGDDPIGPRDRRATAATPAEPISPPRYGARVIGRLSRYLATDPPTAVREACAALIEDIEAIMAEDGGLSPAVAEQLGPALVDELRARLDSADVEALDALAEARLVELDLALMSDAAVARRRGEAWVQAARERYGFPDFAPLRPDERG